MTAERRDPSPSASPVERLLFECATEAAIDGILVVSSEGKMLSLNRQFVEMWRIPAEVAASRSDQAAIAFVLDQLVDPAGFISRVQHLYQHPDERSRDEIALKDARSIATARRCGAPRA